MDLFFMDLVSRIEGIQTRLQELERSEYGTQQWAKLTAPLTSTSWDGDARSDTAKTLIDLSAVFGVPAGVSHVLVRIVARDSGSAAGTGIYFAVSPNDTAGSHAGGVRLDGWPNDSYNENTFICPCDANGDIYFQCDASGAGTLDVYLQIHDYAR